MPFPGGNTAAWWRRPEWIAESDGWIAEHVDVSEPIEERRAEGWSVVRRVPTPGGTVWFKACAPEHAYEVALLERLDHRDDVPLVIASDRARGWLLLEDAGVALRSSVDAPDYLERWSEALRRYALLQIATAPFAAELMAVGVPDRTPRALPDAFAAVLEDRSLLQPDAARTLTDDELAHAGDGIERLRQLAEDAAALGLPDAIEHNDLHDGNILVRGDDLRIIDWGDAAVSHAFGSLALARHVLSNVLDADARDPRIGKVVDAYLEPWADAYPAADLRANLDLGLVLGDVAGAVKWHTVISALAPGERPDFEEHMPSVVRRVLVHL